MSNNTHSFLYGGIVTMTRDDVQTPIWPVQWAGEKRSYTRTGITTLNMSGYMIK